MYHKKRPDYRYLFFFLLRAIRHRAHPQPRLRLADIQLLARSLRFDPRVGLLFGRVEQRKIHLFIIRHAHIEANALNRLRDLREDADLNQTQVAKFLGMSQTGYFKYETGENDIPTQVLIKLAGFYKTTTDYILGISDRRDPI